MKVKTRYLLFIMAIGIIACSKAVDLPNFDESKWQQDLNGCQGSRLAMLDNLKAAKDRLKGLSEDEIVMVLGKPDKNELYKRNQKFYIYEITNAPECGKLSADSVHVYLNIRFNATGLAKEVLIYRN